VDPSKLAKLLVDAPRFIKDNPVVVVIVLAVIFLSLLPLWLAIVLAAIGAVAAYFVGSAVERRKKDMP
jgi:membrane protein implicated in regulation of membrane protease activity